jgi:hypothetical protein
MYIRRKVFSVAIDESGEEKLFSTTEIMSEDSYLEKIYAEAEAEKKSSTGKKVAIGAGATAAAGAGGIYGAGKLGEKMVKSAAKKAKDQVYNDSVAGYKELVKKGVSSGDAKKLIYEEPVEGYKKLMENSKKAKVGAALQKPAKYIAKKLARKG